MSTKRIKQVFSSSQEVFHIWSTQTQDHARQGGRITRAFFSGDSAYSYGRHYEVGRLIKINGIKCVLINTSGYSHTTSKHINEALNATEHLPQIKVDSSFNWRLGILKMQANLIDELLNTINQRTVNWNEYNVWDKETQDRFAIFNQLCIVVGKKNLQLKPDGELIEVLQEHIELCKSKTKAKDLVKAAERLAKQQEQRIKAQSELEDWLKGGSYTYNLRLFEPQLIRIKGDQVETTSQAAVPLTVAREALTKILAGTLPKGSPIGSYEFESFDGETIVVGCHKISVEQAQSVLNKFEVIQGGKS